MECKEIEELAHDLEANCGVPRDRCVPIAETLSLFGYKRRFPAKESVPCKCDPIGSGEEFCKGDCYKESEKLVALDEKELRKLAHHFQDKKNPFGLIDILGFIKVIVKTFGIPELPSEEEIASLLANQRACRNGGLPVTNVLDLLNSKQLNEVMSDAKEIRTMLKGGK